MPITCNAKQNMSTQFSLVKQDIFLCMMYNRDAEALRKVLRCFLAELSKAYDCKDLTDLNESLPLVGLRALFFLLIVIDPKLRYWAIEYENKGICKPPPPKVALFLRTLRDDTIQQWMSDERQTAATFVRKATELYIRC